MKFIKLGSKPDAFQVEGNCVRHVSSELATDVIIIVGDTSFHLRKFPLLSKSNKLQKLASKACDENLAEIARDPNLSVSSFIQLSESIPGSARPIHDGLYGAIDIYLKVRVAAANSIGHNAEHPPRNTHENWGKTGQEDNRKSLRKQRDEMKIKEDEILKTGKLPKRGSNKNRGSVPQLLPSRSRRIFDKLWSVGKGLGNGENKSSETSGSSQSPSSMIRGEIKSSGSSSRYRRHSIS